jgi:hypothetical protein
MVENLGHDDGGAVNRINLSFHHTPTTDLNLEKPIDGLTGIDFQSARLYMRQVNAPNPGTATETWNIFTLSGGLMADAPIADLWDGLYESSTPAASLAKRVEAVTDGVPETWWVWDVTDAFRSSYTGGVSGSIELRIQAENEANPGGVGFYGGDADVIGNRPYIALYVDTMQSVGISRESDLSDGETSVWPNPANPEFNIRYQVKSADNVNLQIYNSQGQLIKTLANGHEPAGFHLVKWNAVHEPSGIYFYRIKIGAKWGTPRKLVVLK